MTNEQFYILLRLYREELLAIKEKCRNCACSKDGNAFAGEIDRLADEIWNDMELLRPERT